MPTTTIALNARAFTVRRRSPSALRRFLAATARWMGWGWVRTYR